ncbi:DUF4317 domain-containing protein [Clostridium sp. LY3-2]|uniref:DUF4317 domain-containing protein n=1 Tax=Clostridium sp. LY3-2 TaxID=2942482 RepID=UPI0021530267|nr:DUF4317 domain-containing protein [Clostridium sp. LY3-2]MCR6515951.1 DUF4317 domain-containing protein [Clostridium sp. LY3-2]
MRKKDILELRKHLKKENCTFTKMCGCYVNSEKNMILNFRESFLNLDEDEYFKYLDIAKKVISGTISNNLLELNFKASEDLVNDRQVSLMQLKTSALKDDNLLNDFYKSIIDNYDYTGNFLIILFHDAYDVITKTSDNLNIDESEEIYEYILCAVCPVSLSEPGLRYYEEENTIGARIRDWVVEAPQNGFVFPAFINRSSDVNSVMYYTKNAKNTHPELMENSLGCEIKQTATIQKEAFQSIIKDSYVADEKAANKIFMEVQENLSNMIEEHDSIYGDTDSEPLSLSKEEMQNLLTESGVPEAITKKIEKSFDENFKDQIPLAENLIDKKTLKENEQRKKEEHLIKEVVRLQEKIEQVKEEASIKLEKEEENTLDSSNIDQTEDGSKVEDNLNPDEAFDVVLKVKPEKVSEIKSQIIDGKKCLVIPINENEQAKVNDIEDLI